MDYWYTNKLPSSLPPDSPDILEDSVFPLIKNYSLYIPKYMDEGEYKVYCKKRKTTPISIPAFGIPDSMAVIGYIRGKGVRFHCGIDLTAKYGDPILACEDGFIARFKLFYKGVYALFVDHGRFVINYGEVDKDSLNKAKLKIDDEVKAGQVIGFVGKMDRSNMLHFEMYYSGVESLWTNDHIVGNQQWKFGESYPKYLMNPTNYLIKLANNKKRELGLTNLQSEALLSDCR